MHFIDILIFILYFSVMLGVGIYFFRRKKNSEDYYIGGLKAVIYTDTIQWIILMAGFAMIVGGGTTITKIVAEFQLPLNLDANIFGIGTSAIVYVIIHFL